jgi:CRISPR-associated protein Csd1
MIKELSELGRTLRGQQAANEWVHDALKEEIISLILTIKPDGSFVSLQPIDKKKTIAEAVQRTSGKGARLLIDNCGYVIGVYDYNSSSFKKKIKEKGELKAHEIFKKDVSDKLSSFIDRINGIGEVEELTPILKFYGDNKERGLDIVSQDYFLNSISKKDRSGNIAIFISGEDRYIHENDSIYQKIIAMYEDRQRVRLSVNKKKCSVCAREDFPVGDFTHFPIKGVPGNKEPAGGRKLISYNGDNNPFESYGMIGNENCMICTSCAKTYVEGLNWLLSTGPRLKSKKDKEYTAYTHRKNFGSDTAMVFWTKTNKELPEIDQLEAPNPDDVARLIESITSGGEKNSLYIEPDKFYSFTLSGSAARIAVRDWIETSLYGFRESIAQWFQDIAIAEYNGNLKKLKTYYARLYDLARSCQRKNSDGSYDKDDVSLARTAACLWNAALTNTSLPLWILTKALHRARLDIKKSDDKYKYRDYGVTTDSAALIKLILNRLNRNNKGGGFMITEKLEEGSKPVAYVCGQVFAKLESIQYWALGERNAGIRERYFTYAMTLPSSAFGRLFDLNSKHYKKLKNEKPGLAVNLDKELQDLVKDIDINKLPATFSLEEKGQFAIGYYHQRQLQFSGVKSNENEEEE